MSLSIFDEKALIPTEDMLSEALSDTRTIWNDALKLIDRTCGDLNTEWKYYSRSAGWTLVANSKKRKMTYFIPLKGFFKVNFVFGEKAVKEAKSADLPESVLLSISEARPYVEGRSFMIDMKTDTDIELFGKLLKIKNNT
jgi:hypothetical protein